MVEILSINLLVTPLSNLHRYSCSGALRSQVFLDVEWMKSWRPWGVCGGFWCSSMVLRHTLTQDNKEMNLKVVHCHFFTIMFQVSVTSRPRLVHAEILENGGNRDVGHHHSTRWWKLYQPLKFWVFKFSLIVLGCSLWNFYGCCKMSVWLSYISVFSCFAITCMFQNRPSQLHRPASHREGRSWWFFWGTAMHFVAVRVYLGNQAAAAAVAATAAAVARCRQSCRCCYQQRGFSPRKTLEIPTENFRKFSYVARGTSGICHVGWSHMEITAKKSLFLEAHWTVCSHLCDDWLQHSTESWALDSIWN